MIVAKAQLGKRAPLDRCIQGTNKTIDKYQSMIVVKF